MVVKPQVQVVHGLLPDRKVEAALRRIHLYVAQYGLTAQELSEWATTTAFPHLRWEPQIITIRDYIEGWFGLQDVEWCHPQIIYRYPDLADEWPITYHVDETPEGGTFGGIYAAVLTRSHRQDGCLIVDGDPIEADRGDVIVLDPLTPHAASLNKGGGIRATIYYRHL